MHYFVMIYLDRNSIFMAAKKIILIVSDLANLGDQFLCYVQSRYLLEKNNFGDRVILATWETTSIETTLWFEKHNITVKSIKRNPLIFILSCLNASISLGGGHVIRETLSWRFISALILISTSTYLGRNNLNIIGAGCARINSTMKSLAWKYVLGRCSFIGIRDETSLKNFSLNFSSLDRKAHLTTDVAFLYNQEIYLKKHDDKICLVSLANDSSESRSVDNQVIFNLISELYSKNLINKVHFVAHDPRSGLDLMTSQDCATMINKKMGLPSKFIECRTLDDLLNQYEHSHIILTARLHGLILGALNKKPVISINDSSEKLRPFADLFSYPTISNQVGISRVNLLTLEQIEICLDRNKHIENVLNEQRRKAAENFNHL
jgi:polysaccharide pyruvyl transferase WcaK-like protein